MTEDQAAELLELLGEITAELSATAWPVSEIIAGASGIIAILAFFWTIYSYRNQQANDLQRRKAELTLALSSEWDSPEMLGRRILVDQYLKEREDDTKPFSSLYAELPFERPKDGNNEIGWIDISHILHFPEKIGHLVDNEELEMDLCRSLLANDFNNWVFHIRKRKEKEGGDSFKKFLEPAMNAPDAVVS